MARRREEVDWYVEMSDWLERRDHRRKWVILAICVAVPLFLMIAGVIAIELHSRGLLPGLPSLRDALTPREKAPVTPEKHPQMTVEKFVTQVKFPQLNPDGLVTTVTHFFREVPLELEGNGEIEKGFLVLRETDKLGVIERYQLLNSGTGEAFTFDNVPVKKLDETAGWVISDEGWRQIRDELKAKMQTDLGVPVRQ